MKAPSRRASAALGAVAIAGSLMSLPAAQASSVDRNSLTVREVKPESRITGAKSVSGQAAQSDAKLLARTDSAMVNVVIKLDYDAFAAYQGNLPGLAATSPSVTGKDLTGKSAAELAYGKHISSMDAAARKAIAAKVPGAKLGKSIKIVYGGIAARIRAKDAAALLKVPGVAAVQSDTLNKPQVVEGPEFIGATTLWTALGGQSKAGRGVIFADLDSGVWPEHPMLASHSGMRKPPAAPSGQPRPCDFGDNPLTPAVDVFQCNNKLIGGKAFLDTYLLVNGSETYTTARDSDGHGTHTTTTAAGNAVTTANVLGVNRGPISGVAPGAWVLEYKVCGAVGCYGSDSAAAVGQAILDGAKVINFSISGGTNPYSDPVEMAFLDAYEAGVFVATSAGNEGPGAATVNHFSPWTTTVAASTQVREFQSTLTLTDGSDSVTLTGASITDGVTADSPVVMAESIPGYDALCSTALPAGAATGKIVACRRGVVGRVQKGYNVKQGGAAGMILYNSPLQDVETDNHWLPTVHLADGADFVAFMSDHPTAVAHFTAGVAVAGTGNVMAAFSSRGPGGQFLKPDITAPGVQVLAGQTPTPDDVSGGPSGESYMAIAGTSMSSPMVAGSAILVKAAKRAWGPGMIKSALMTTARQNVVKEDLTTPADPFDMGAGHVDLTKAASAPISFSESGVHYRTRGQDPATAANLNLPSVNLPTMPGSVTVRRTARNLSGHPYAFTVQTSADAGSSITVTPSSGTIPRGGTQTFKITVTSSADPGQYFGAIQWVSAGATTVRMPVAFNVQQGATTLTSACDPDAIAVAGSTTCTVTATNTGTTDATVSLRSTADPGTTITGATGATVVQAGKAAIKNNVMLAAPKDAVPAIASTTDSPAGGYLDLEDVGLVGQAIDDEEAINFTVPAFSFGGQSFTRVGVVSNGYLVLGGADSSEDIQYLPQNLPDPARPNGVLSPYWTDLDGGGQEGIRAAILTDGVHSWLVLQWDVAIFGDPSAHRGMQAWIGLGDTEDITYEYANDTIGSSTPAGTGLTVGVESVQGVNGAMLAGSPTGSLRVSTTPGQPGGSVSYSLQVRGNTAGSHPLLTKMTSSNVLGATVVRAPLTVN